MPAQASCELHGATLSLRCMDARTLTIEFPTAGGGDDRPDGQKKTHRFMAVRRALGLTAAPAPAPAPAIAPVPPARGSPAPSHAGPCATLDMVDADEGPPVKRIHARLEYWLANRPRLLERCATAAAGSIAGVAATASSAAAARAASSGRDGDETSDCSFGDSDDDETATPHLLKFGWALYDAKRELRRLGVPDAAWRLTDANASYELCATYPRILAVPRAVDDATLAAVAEYRSKGRIPVLSWRDPVTRATLSRCSLRRAGTASRGRADGRPIGRTARGTRIARRTLSLQPRRFPAAGGHAPEALRGRRGFNPRGRGRLGLGHGGRRRLGRRRARAQRVGRRRGAGRPERALARRRGAPREPRAVWESQVFAAVPRRWTRLFRWGGSRRRGGGGRRYSVGTGRGGTAAVDADTCGG